MNKLQNFLVISFHYSDCKCITCHFGGGPNQTKEILEKNYCVKCSFNEQINRTFSVTKMLEITDQYEVNFDNNIDIDGINVDEYWREHHNYHLSWAVFQHLSSMYLIFL